MCCCVLFVCFCVFFFLLYFFFFQAEDGIRDAQESRGLGDVYKRQATNTSHWKMFVFSKACGICFLYDTRLKFLEKGLKTGKGAPMSCAMIYWGSDFERFYSHFIEFGAVVDISALIGERIGKDRQQYDIMEIIDNERIRNV